MRADKDTSRGFSIGVVAISRNEEIDLPGFLNHLLSWVDEIVIVDDASTDGTRRIAKNAGDRVRVVEQTMEHKDGYAGQRNRGIDEARSDWLLHMDIDERVTPALAQEICAAANQTRMNAFRYRRKNFFLHRPMKAGGWNDWNNPQLARRGTHWFEGAIHEKCIVEGGNARTGQLKEPMWHLNDESYRERMAKSFAYSQAICRSLAKRGKRVRWYCLLWYPVREFLVKYVGKRGFIDGVPGLLFSLHSACSIFRSYALLWDEQHNVDRNSLEVKIEQLWRNAGGVR